MSIIRSLLRFIDPIEHRRITEDERKKREVRPPAPQPDDPPRVCRICGHQGTGRFCPDCLAETMELTR
jgi:hypothetical protein